MRLTATALVEGWTNLTDSALLVLNDCQFTERFWLPWVMVVVAPAWLMLPLPAVISPPCGPACASGVATLATAITPRDSLRRLFLPGPRVSSDTAIKAWCAGLQIRR